MQLSKKIVDVMIHKIETINNLHTSYKLSRWKVLTKGLTKTVYINIGLTTRTELPLLGYVFCTQ